MIPGSKASKAVRACTKGFELGILKNIKTLRELCTKELSKLLCIAFQVTDTFLRVFGLGSLADLPPLHGEAAESAEPEETEGDDGQLEWK